MTDLSKSAAPGGQNPKEHPEGEEPDEAVFTTADPFRLFEEWLERARGTEPNDPNAMALATVSESGMPNVRMVLLKGVDEDGFVFYTNLESQKGEELKANQVAALCFHWKSQRRQIRVQGIVEAVSSEEADAYFASRPKDSQIGAWASKQSRHLEGRFELEAEVAKYAAKYALTKVPRPPHWSGFRIRPIRFEFWRDRWFRLHDRVIFHRDDVEKGDWMSERLYP